MMRPVLSMAAAVLLLAASASTLSAQLAVPEPGREIASVAVKLGVLSPRTTFNDASFGESSFEEGMAVGVAVSAWPLLGRRVGFRGQLMRSQTDGENSTSELAPIAVNDPNVYLYTLELAVRQAMSLGAVSGAPYLSAGWGGKQYSWAVSQHKTSRFATLTASTGVELRPRALGAFGVNAELRAYSSHFRAFGIDDGSWSPGFYGGEVGGVENLDVLLTVGASLNF
jgi:hypothetical protein